MDPPKERGFEAKEQLVTQPIIETSSPLPGWHACDPIRSSAKVTTLMKMRSSFAWASHETRPRSAAP